MGATWDKELISRAGAVQGYEARYITQHDKVPVLVVWGPNADLSRDPRWGRNEESYGEDSFSDRNAFSRVHSWHAGRRSEVLAGGVVDEALPGQQQRNNPRQFVF